MSGGTPLAWHLSSRVTVHAILAIKVGAEEGEAGKSVDIDDHGHEQGDPQQRGAVLGDRL